MSTTPPSRPARISLGDVAVFVVRGPHKGDDALWYWRARGPRKVELGARWATERQAATWAAELLLGAQGRPVAEPEPGCELVVDLLGMYLYRQLHERSDIEENTRASSSTTVKRLSRKDRGLRTVRVERLDRGAVDVYVRSARAQGQAESTTALDLRVLRAAWAWGRSEGLTPDRVLEVPKLKGGQAKPRYTPSPAQIREVLDHLDGPERVALALQAELGARIGEVLSIRLGDLEWPEGWAPVRVVGEDSPDGWVTLSRHEGARKTGKARRVPLSVEAFALLQGLGYGPKDAPEEQAFPGSLASVRHRVNKRLVDAVKACGQPPWTSHALRRATVRRLLRGGHDAGVAARLLGHSTSIMLDVYDQPQDSDLSAAARAVRLTLTGA